MGVDPVRVVQDNGGAATTSHLLRAVTRWQLRMSVEAGTLRRAGRGIYVLPEEIHITLPHGLSRKPRPGVVIHRARHIDPDDLRDRRTSPLRTVLDCASTLPFVEALAVADSALKYGLVTPPRLASAAAATRGPGRTSRLQIARHADGRAANAFESVLRGLLVQAGITTFVPQLVIHAGPLSLQVDLADPFAGVVLEADSFEFHGSRADFRRDCERYDELVAAGWVVLRLPWELVMFDHEKVLRLVTEAMNGGHGGSSERTVRT